MFNFYALPIENRLMIYEECLVVGKIYPYSLSDADETAQEAIGCDLPAVALLQVSKTIRMEAEPILYQRNDVQLGSAEFSRKFFERCLNTPERKLWLKSVFTLLECYDITEADREVVLNIELGLARHDMLFPEEVHQSPQQIPWEAKLHDAYKKYLGEFIWPQKLLPLLDYCSLKKLAVHFGCAECQAECCKMRAQAVLSFSKGFAMGFPTQFVTEKLGVGKSASEKLIRSWTARRIADLEDRKLLLDIFPGE